MRNIWRALNSDDLKKMGAAVDEEATQDTENQSYGDERPPIVFEEWVAAVAPVADRRATSVFKTWVCHYPYPRLVMNTAKRVEPVPSSVRNLSRAHVFGALPSVAQTTRAPETPPSGS